MSSLSKHSGYRSADYIARPLLSYCKQVSKLI